MSGVGRQPRMVLTVNGIEVHEILAASVRRNNHLAADGFSVKLALNRISAFGGYSQWSEANRIDATLAMTSDQNGPVGVISGVVDEVTVDMAKSTLTLTGRDYSALFIETLTAEKFQNLTSSQVAETLAARQGLQAQITSTSVLTGKYYDSDHAMVTNEISQWALLSYLAQREGFDIFVEGKVLYFQPAANESNSTPYDIFFMDAGANIPSNVQRLLMRRKLGLAADVLVKVISWNHERKTAITSTRRAHKINSATASGGDRAAQYTFREAGLAQTQADTTALTKLTELAQHERIIEFDLPGDLTLTPRSLLRLSGTGTGFDQVYFTSEMHISFDQRHGFSMRVLAKNASPYEVMNS
jgi:phage protein D